MNYERISECIKTFSFDVLISLSSNKEYASNEKVRPFCVSTFTLEKVLSQDFALRVLSGERHHSGERRVLPCKFLPGF